MRIEDCLQYGKANATDGKTLAKLLNVSQRDVLRIVAEARKEGVPICATSKGKAGYYLTDSPEELQNYCGRLHHRATEMLKAHSALVKTLREIEKQQSGQITLPVVTEQKGNGKQ